MQNYVKQFMVAGDVFPTEFSPRLTALYIGLQAEEFSEKLQAIQKQLDRFDEFNSPVRILINQLKQVSDMFKQGDYDDVVATADRVAMLDGDIDLAWVSLGGAYAMAADVEGAINEVGRSNLSKADPVTGKMAKDINGKIMKPDTFSPPNLVPFVK